MKHFPDKFYKTVPPKTYFWRVLAIIRPKDYDKYISQARNRIITVKKTVRNNIIMTDEAIRIFDNFTETDLNLIGIVIS